jgi:hypothetical protein
VFLCTVLLLVILVIAALVNRVAAFVYGCPFYITERKKFNSKVLRRKYKVIISKKL